MAENILEVKNLSVSFDGNRVIDDLSFDFKEKDILVFLGPNGAGKTVLLKTLLGIFPFQGEIKWRENIKIGYVPQKFLPDKNIPLSVEEFFKFKKIDSKQIMAALESVGLKDKTIFQKKIGTLSSGQLQRILIAWALIDNPNILFFDEPTSGIDIEGEETIYNLLNQIEKERDLTIILITHDLSVVYKFADSVLCLNKKAVCQGPPQEVLKLENLNRLYGGEIKIYKHGH